ncbi:MAG: hypothetical protein Q9168_006458 [Polycauliona sp. 1 TL-2023]
MGKKRKHLSHEEIWDDSALVNSWDLALQEYKLYHSIHARGERVEDVLKEAEVSEALPKQEEADGGNETFENMNGIPQVQEPKDEEVEEGEIEDEAVASTGAMDPTVQTKDEIHPGQEHYAPPPTAAEPNAQKIPEPSALPAILMNGGETQHAARSIANALLMGTEGQDEGLKNLMMSWYYAGYYTGLHEGRQQPPDPTALQPTGDSQARP